jgi:hypothetical protein
MSPRHQSPFKLCNTNGGVKPNVCIFYTQLLMRHRTARWAFRQHIQNLERTIPRTVLQLEIAFRALFLNSSYEILPRPSTRKVRNSTLPRLSACAIEHWIRSAALVSGDFASS